MLMNQGIQNVGNQNRLSVLLGFANHHGNGNVVAARAEGACEEIERAAANCPLENNLQQASTSGTQSDKAPVYDSDGSAEEQYTELLEPIPEPHQVPQNDSNVISKSVYQEQCLTKKIYALHLSSGKQVTDLNEEISNLNKQLSKEKSTVSSLQEEKKTLKSDFKIREDELLDKQIQLENKIKELDNILVKTGQSIQTMHMLSPKPDLFYHTEQKMALGYQNTFYLKQAQQKQQSLYNGKVLLEKHDPPTVYDSEETLELAQEKAAKFVRDFQSLAKEADESLAKHKALELEIERLVRAVGKSKDTPCESNTLDPLPQKLENENVELEFQVQNYEKENAHLKTVYKNLFDSINVIRTQTKLIIDSLQNKLHDTIYENAKLRAQLFDKVSKQKDTSKGTSTNTKFANQSTERKLFLQYLRNQFVVRQPNAFQSERPNFSKNQIPQKVDTTNDLSNPVTSNSVPITNESKVVDNDKVIAPGMFRINPFKNSREVKFMPNKSIKASIRTNLITIPQPHVITKKAANSDSNGFSSTGVDITTKTRRPQPRSNTKNG
ncbi:hypothetical protein Tco_1250539 [Tanacetum coccineum]